MEIYNNLRYRINVNVALLIFGLLGAIIVLILPFSPYIALVFCFPLLTILDVSSEKSKFLYILIISLIVVLLSYLGSTRGLFETMKDDLSDYYKNFIALSRGNLMALFEFGSGIEFGFSLISFVISWFFPYCSPRLFLFFHLLFINTLYFLFLHKHLMKNIKSKSLFILTACLFLGFTGESNLLRQSYSSIFILFAIFSVERKKIISYLILATVFHFSALIIFFYFRFIFRFIANINIRTFLFFSISSVFVILFFDTFVEPFLENYRYFKIDAYLNGEGVDLLVILSTYKEYFLAFIVLSIACIFNKVEFSVLLIIASWLLSVAVMEVVMSGISLRINHAIIIFLTGPLLYFTFSRGRAINLIFAATLIPLIFVAKVYSFTENKNDMALFSDGKFIYATPFEYVGFLTRSVLNDKREWKSLKYN